MSEDALNRLYPQAGNEMPEVQAEPMMEPQPQPEEMYQQETYQPTPEPARKRRLKGWHKILLGFLGVLIVIGVLVGAVGFYIFGVVMQMQAQGNDISKLASDTSGQFKAQNLPGTEQDIKAIAQKVTDMRGTFTKLSFLNVIPFARSYYQDGIHGFNAADAGLSAALKSVQAVEPYADVLGFKGQGSFSGGTAEDRLKLLLQTLSKVTPQLDSIEGDLTKVQTEIGAIDPNRYPNSFMGHSIRPKVQEYHDLSSSVITALTEFRPLIENLPAAAGADGRRRKYFVLFQNDNELRPTGGFWTAFSIINIDGGKIDPEKSDDIYSLDKKFKEKLPIPPILAKYLTTEKYLNLRDMNTAPDFEASVQQFLTYYKTLPDEEQNIDGVIAVDTRVLTDLFKLFGPVNIDTYGTFSAETDARCNCPQDIYALSEIIDRPVNYVKTDRKGILGPMMHEILQRAYTAPKVMWPQLLNLAWNNIQGRHVQVYFLDPTLEAAVQKVGAAGTMQRDPSAQDFLGVVDANLGGAKSNLFTTSDIDQVISAPSNGTIDKKVTITYKNSRGGDNCNLEAGQLCLNAAMPDWNRLYLPKGSKLVNAQGYNEPAKQYDEGDFTVIEGTFVLEPQSTSKLQIEYTVPYTDTQKYRVQLWKQGGVVSVPELMEVNGNQDKVTLDKDVMYETKF